MKRILWVRAGAFAIAVVSAACADSSTPLSPENPTSGSAAAASGSSLKVSAPTPQSPVNDQVTSGPPTLVASAAIPEYTPLPLKYRFQVFNPSAALVQDSGLMNGPTFTVGVTLASGTRYTWKVRAEYEATPGPWSQTASFVSSGSSGTSGGSGGSYGNWEACGSLSGFALVSCVHALVAPTGTASDFEVIKRVAWLLRGSGAGLLIKNSGENIVSWQGYSFSATRICFPNGNIVKLITDAGDGGTNGAAYNDDGFVDSSLYVPAIDPNKP